MASTVPARTSSSKPPRKRSKPGPPVLRLSTASDPVTTHHEHLLAWFESTRGILEHLIGDCCEVLRAAADHDHPFSKVMGDSRGNLREVIDHIGNASTAILNVMPTPLCKFDLPSPFPEE
ncbi:MAG: hypothetical protein K8U57_20465 [Planctomycetes bacterium]|nr:hypothetical protein [Planctomycetota bacterium]